MTDQLFDPEPYAVTAAANGSADGANCEWSAMGQAAEMILCGELLYRGHSVYRPVSDHEGIDLIVDGRLAVQVKSSVDQAISKGFRLRSTRGRRGNGRNQERLKEISASVGVVALLDWQTRTWYFVPRDVIGSRQQFKARPNSPKSAGRANADWREAWHLFDTAVAA